MLLSGLGIPNDLIDPQQFLLFRGRQYRPIPPAQDDPPHRPEAGPAGNLPRQHPSSRGGRPGAVEPEQSAREQSLSQLGRRRGQGDAM
jgi:hypothetical protein